MRKVVVWIGIVISVLLTATALLVLYGHYLENRLRTNIPQVKVGMTEAEVIRILGEPSNRGLSDIPGTYWYYETDPLAKLIDDNPDRVGHLVLEMSADGRVVKVFDVQ